MKKKYNTVIFSSEISIDTIEELASAWDIKHQNGKCGHPANVVCSKCPFENSGLCDSSGEDIATRLKIVNIMLGEK